MPRNKVKVKLAITKVIGTILYTNQAWEKDYFFICEFWTTASPF